MSLRSALVVLFVVGVLVGCRSEQVSNQPIAPAATWAPYGPQQYYASPMGMPPSSPPGANPPACCPLPTPAPMVIQPMALNCMTTWVQDGKIHVTSLFPTGDPATSQVYVELIGPTEVAINQPFDYQIIVKNLSPCTLIDVIVCDTISAIAEFIKSTPRESKCAALADGLENCRQSRRICWDLGTLAPQEAKTIDVTAVVRAAGDVAHCITVDWKRNICIPLAVIESKLQLTKTAPAEVMACEPIPMKLTVTNTGSSLAKGVKIKDTLPSGLATQDGKTTVDFDAGDLIQGQSREFTIMAQASRPGRYTNTAIATAERGATSEATSTTVVRAPVLEITKSASRSTVFAGQPVVYELTVANKGDGAAKDTVLKDMIPAGTSFKSASDGGRLADNTVVWDLGTLASGASKKVTLEVKAEAITTSSKNTATAEAFCAKQVSTSTEMAIRGIPAILLELIDIEDPVAVGTDTTYVITATNQGSQTDTNVHIVCTLEPNAQYVAADGATVATAKANVVDFAPLAALPAKEKAVWRVQVKALKAGDVRFKVTMTSGNIGRPVEETEATNFYEP